MYGCTEVKAFLKTPGNADSYENLEVKFIPGRNPDLIIFVSVLVIMRQLQHMHILNLLRTIVAG